VRRDGDIESTKIGSVYGGDAYLDLTAAIKAVAIELRRDKVNGHLREQVLDLMGACSEYLRTTGDRRGEQCATAG